MHRSARVKAAITITAAAIGAGQALPATAPPGTFEALEARLSEALATYDRATLDKLWDDQLVFVFPNGAISRKAERLKAQIRPADSGGPKLVATNDAVQVTYADPHMAVVIVRSSWRFGDQPSEPFVAMHVWTKRGASWRLMSAQVAEVKAPKSTP